MEAEFHNAEWAPLAQCNPAVHGIVLNGNAQTSSCVRRRRAESELDEHVRAPVTVAADQGNAALRLAEFSPIGMRRRRFHCQMGASRGVRDG